MQRPPWSQADNGGLITQEFNSFALWQAGEAGARKKLVQIARMAPQRRLPIGDCSGRSDGCRAVVQCRQGGRFLNRGNAIFSLAERRLVATLEVRTEPER